MIRLLIALTLLAFGSNEVKAQLDTIHWIPPLHSRTNGDIEDHYVYLSTPKTSSFQVTIQDGSGNPISGSPFTISNSNPAEILIGNGQNPPTELMVPYDSLNTVLSHSGLILKAPKPFYANTRYQGGPQSASLTAKGTSAKGKTFRVGSMPIPADNGRRNFVMSVQALKDSTNILVKDYAPGVTFNGPSTITSDSLSLSLNAGETYVLSGYSNISANLQGFIGALINANKPVVVNTGNWTGSTSTNLQDIGIDQIVPIQKVGTDYITIEGNGQSIQERPLVVAHHDSTEVYVNGGGAPVTTLQAGEWHLISNSNYSGTNHRNMSIQTSKPTYLYQILAGSNSLATPGMNFIPPVACGMPKKVDLIPSVSKIGNFSYNGDIIAFTKSTATLNVNGNPQAGAEVVSGKPNWKTYKISGFTGDVTITSTESMAAGMYGFNGLRGYAGYFSGFSLDVNAEFSIKDSACYQDSLAITFTGDSTSSTAFNWQFGPANVISGSGAGPYTITYDSSGVYPIKLTVSDSGCIDSIQKTVKVFDRPTVSDSIVDLTCHGSSNGQILLSVTDGVTPYKYSWGHGPSDSNLTSVQAGTYEVTVSDDIGCSVTDTSEVSKPPMLIASITDTLHSSCHNSCNGSATITPSGGTPPYTYQWNDPNNQTDSIAQSLCAGSYTVTITDANGCDTSVSVTITEPPALTATITDSVNASCYGTCDGSASVTANGGTPPYSYSWSNGVTDSSISGVCTGTYGVTITDANGCQDSAQVTITEPPVLSVDITDTTHVSCNGGSDGAAKVTPSGGTSPYTFDWGSGVGNNPSDSSNSGLAAGTYDVTVTDNHGCDTTIAVSINEPPVLMATITDSTNISCNSACDGSVTVTPSGGTSPYIFSWSNGDTDSTATGLCAGTHNVTVTDNQGCDTTISVTINEPPVLTATITDSTSISCNGACDGFVTVTPSGGTPPYTYQWNDPNNQTDSTAQNLCAGSYTVTITDAHGCDTTVSLTFTEPSVLTATMVDSMNATCHGGCDGSAAVAAGGGTPPYSYAWNNGGTDSMINGVCSGSYNVTITDANGCDTTASVTISQPPNLSGSITNVQNVSCHGGCDGSAMVIASGGTTPYTYTWGNGASDSLATGLCAGSHTVTITDANNCDTTITLNINEPEPLAISTQMSQGVSCNGENDGAASASISGGTSPYNYYWSSGDSTTNVSDKVNQITNLTAGNYQVTVEDENGCTITDALTINEPPTLSLSAAVDSHVTCYGYADGVATANASGGTSPYDFQWSFGDGMVATMDSLHTVTGLSAGNYSIHVTDQNGCTDTALLTVTQPPETLIDIPQDLYKTKLGDEVKINATPIATDEVTYRWRPADGLNCVHCEDPLAHPETTTQYTITMTDKNGCIATDTTKVMIVGDKILYIPNAFSPNGDGTNDQFKVHAKGVEEFRMMIFDRWGEKVFETHNIDNGWNGTVNGRIAKPGPYIYTVFVKFVDNEVLQKEGSVTIIR